MAVFSEAFLRLRQDFDQGHENRGKLIRDIRADVRELSRQTVSQIAEQSRTRRAAFAAMMGGLRDKIQQQVAKLVESSVFIGTSSWKYPGWRGML